MVSVIHFDMPCESCFEDERLRRLVRECGEPGDGPCEYCNEHTALVAPPEIFTEMFERIVRDRYRPIEEIVGVHDYLEAGDQLITLFEDDFPDAFSPAVIHREHLLIDILNAGRGYGDGQYTTYGLWGKQTQDATYWSHLDYWSVFGLAARTYGLALLIRRPKKPIRGGRDVKDAVAVLTQAAQEVECIIPAGQKLWRARLGSGFKRAEMGAPLATLASPGRGNFAGQPVLYTCLDRQTAYYEVRPTISETVTVRRLLTTRELRICDLQRRYESCTPFVEGDAAYEEYLKISSRNRIRRQIGTEFATPVKRGDEATGYLPTQVFTALLRRLHFDGLMFSSSLRPAGANLILFDPEDAKITRFVSEFGIRKLQYTAQRLPRRRKSTLPP